MDQQSDAQGHRSALGGQMRVLRRRWRLIALVTLLVVAASLAYSFTRVPEYRSSADVLISPTAFDVQRGGAELAPEEIATQVRIVTSRPVAELVRGDLRLSTTPSLDELVSVEALGNSRVLRITSRTSHPDEAAEVAASVARSYLVYRQTNTQQTLEEVTEALAARQQALESRLVELDAALARPRDADGGDIAAERRDVVSELGQVTAQLTNLDISVGGGAGGQLLDSPDETIAQVAPRTLLNAVLSLFIGLLAGVAVALLRDRLDTVAHDEEGLVPALGPAHVLARVPSWKATTPEHRIVTVSRPDGPSSQAFQELAAKVRFTVSTAAQTVGRGAVVMCTSAVPDEGKSDVAANLAVAAAKVGMRVVLVDADLRRGAGEGLPGVDASAPGLSDVLLTGRSVEQCLVPGPVDNVSILPRGVALASPTELLVSARMRPVVAALVGRVDLVVVDAPSAGYADSLEVAGLADVTILVTRLGRSKVPAVRAAAERLHDIGADNLGAVVIGGSGQAQGRDRSPSPPARRKAGDGLRTDQRAASGPGFPGAPDDHEQRTAVARQAPPG